MNNLVLFDSLDLSKASNENFYTTTEIIAERTGNTFKAVSDLVRRYRDKLEEVAPLRFSVLKKLNPQGGRPTKIYHLNEQQTLFFIPLLGNTPAVVQFKFELAKAFFTMRNELQARQIARAVEKPQGKTLHQAISEWGHFLRHGNMWHTIIRTLLATTVTGLTLKGIKSRDTDWRKEKTILDLLTLEEMERYKLLESIVIAMILAGSDYEPIKQAIKNTIATKKVLTDQSRDFLNYQ
ncbi:Rha family transcriptional regulator [Lactococcus raffinolactis]|uniref:Rha family transcriptional regulator n=1 Tax=Pseudolactococcus raffinolactis TaxID=1366 RepID=UPI00288E437F|nr:Rha family transcriptional regulator [Lactococcus raffinolactis]MDT2765080.1 Rha family transcriptional regulator [Lactococcus raffinolactis]MDT2788768.1 Rha family transcriptional regulator [Lactococcus raffinolactis]